ncbi:hypothetical protein C8R43DRAFT_1128054 [Mycena crocata]|nr:hypothetical protein C8R43DRAFT_1128054 [Mycena crocata]
MSSLSSWIPFIKGPPQLIELAVNSSGYTPSQDSLHNDPRRYRFSSPRPPSASPADLERVHKNSSEKRPQREIKTEPISDSSVSRAIAQRASVPDSNDVDSELTATLVLVEDLLAQNYLPQSTVDELTKQLRKCAQGAMTETKQTIEDLLKPLSLNEHQHKTLNDSILMRIYDYQVARDGGQLGTPTSSNRIPSSRPSARVRGANTTSPNQTSTRRPSSIPENASSAGLPTKIEVKVTEEGFGDLDIAAHERGFESRSSKGSFTFYNSTSHSILHQPPTISTTLRMGDIWIHTNTLVTGRQVWVYSNKAIWTDISEFWENGVKFIHPTIADRYLQKRNDGSPNWVLTGSWKGSATGKSKSPSASAPV